MWNLIKNVFRSLKHNKASVVGLTFLVFLSIGIFTILNSVSSNISNEYSRITTSGNLHDFTISENYVIGNAKYDFDNNPFDPTDPTKNEYMGESSDGKSVPWPEQNDLETGFQRTYQVSLNSVGQEETLLGIFYQNHDTDPNYSSLLHPIVTIESQNIKKLTYMDADHTSSDHVSTESYDSIMNEIKNSGTEGENNGDLDLLSLEVNPIEVELINVITQTDTPMQQFLSTDFNEKVAWRNFKSLDVTNSPDGKLYKMIQSNPEDQIDKIVLFGNNQQNNFSVNEFNPLVQWGIDLKQMFPDTDDPIGALLAYNEQLPDTYVDFVSGAKAEESQAFFKLLASGDDVYNLEDTDLNLYNIIKSLAFDPTNNEELYKSYIDNYKSHFLLQNKGYRYSINWTVTSPQSWSLRDWTAQYVVVSPEFLQRNGITPYQISNRNQFIQNINDGYIHNIDSDYTLNQFNSFINEHKNNTILNSSEVSMPFVVIGSGITADFTYPILDIMHSNPNPTNECIIFGNSHAYNRMFDAYRGNFTENYLVGSFNKGVNQSQVLDQMNQKAKEVMNWPKDIQACYMANDTTNVLNASAFRVAFIPSLVNKIRLIDVALTAFVIILSLFICAIVIQRYISNNRTQIGVMQANGISKRRIAFSLMPFALLPAILGGFSGYLIGFFLQKPAISLFSNYWMLPTPIASFNILVLLFAILVPFLIFIAVSIISVFIQLREKTVNLMKNGSEFKGSFIARHIKEPFRSFGIMTKFRISTAFNSIWKLIVLSVMVSLSISTLVFGINMIGKFSYAESNTFASRNYSYAVDLYSPTNQGGQYIPVNADVFGQTGFVQSIEGKNWIPSIYFDGQSAETDSSYEIVFPSATGYEYYGIPKVYYDWTYDIYDITHPTLSGDIQQSFIDDEGKTHASILYPMMSDAIGEANDLMYLKNRSMIETALNFTVGALGMTSNPWSVAVSLMPENSKNTSDQRTVRMIQALGEAVMWGDGVNPDPNNNYKNYYNDSHFSKIRERDEEDQFFNRSEELPINQRIDPNCPYNYTLNKTNCISSFIGIPIGNLEPDFMSFINYVYSVDSNDGKPNFEIANVDYDTALDNDYSVVYNKIPLKSFDEPDETYTYLSGKKVGTDSNVRVVGLKSDSKYVDLTNAGGKKINALLNDTNTINDIKQGFYPIIINAYAQHKYHLSVGDNIQFTIDNKADRITREMANDSSNPIQTFKVVGINTTYQGEEYFTNQQLANHILGLRSSLLENDESFDNTCKLNNWYFNSEKEDATIDEIFNKQWWEESYNIANSTDYDKNQISDLLNLSKFATDDSNINPALSYDESEGTIVPYGFNGVFTRRNNGSAILNGGMTLYSPSGIYPGNDALNSNVTKDILKQSANLEIANIISGIIDLPNNPDGTLSIGKKIDQAYVAWQTAASESPERQQRFNDMINLVDEFTNKLTSIYGTSSVISLVSGAQDRDSTYIIFNNLSNTISQVETVVLAIVSLMVIIIVMLISVMLIGDSKKLAAILKALGYSDRENVSSFLSIYVPVIGIGLLLSIPLSFLLIYGFQAIIFFGAGILLTLNAKWWSFLIGIGAIGIIFTVSGFWGYSSLKRERLIDMMKG